MSLISLFYPPCKSWLYVEGELIWPRSSASIHKYFLSLSGDFGDPWSLISRDTRLAPQLIQLKELFLWIRLSSNFLLKHIMCFFIILFQLWMHYLQPGAPQKILCGIGGFEVETYLSYKYDFGKILLISCLGSVTNKKVHKKGKILNT